MYVQATATFIETIEALNYAAENPIIGEIKPALERLSLILKKLNQKLGPEFSSKYNSFTRLYTLGYLACRIVLRVELSVKV